MRKTLLFIILGALLLVAAGCGGGGGSSNSSTGSTSLKSIAVNSSIQKAIEAYFNTYFDAEKSLSYSKMDSSILEDNENTFLSETFREVELARKKLFSEGISHYQYKITYNKSADIGNETAIELSLNLNFHYSDAPSDLNSAIGLNYSFSLKNNGSELIITKVDSDLEKFKLFKADVEEAMAQNSALSKKAAIEQVGKSWKNKVEMMRGNRLYFEGVAPPASAAPNANAPTDATDDTESASEAGSAINKSVYVSCQKFTYNKAAMIAYAEKYYNVEEDSSVSPIFQIATRKDEYGIIHNVDCTSFISQCLWAGYTGFNPSNITTAEKYISKRIGMVPSAWYRTKDGSGTSTWANVKDFFEYMVNNKKIGPNGTTDFRNYNERHTIDGASINVGDVIQLWDDRQGYCHSIIIVRKDGNLFQNIYYSGHTNARFGWKLSEAGYYMRRLIPAATCYLKSE